MMARRILRTALVAVLVLVALGAGAFWWTFVRDDAPAAARLVDRDVAAQPTAGVDGTWSIQAGPDVFAGYRIDEHTVVGIDNTAVARTEGIEGSMVVAGNRITEVSVTADMTGLVSQDSQVPGVGNRDAAMRTAGLETDAFPTASFRLTEPIDLGSVPASGQELTVEARGELVLHGVAREVSVPISARWNGEVVDLTASAPIPLADFGIEQPAVQFVTIADVGTLELQLTFVPAS